LTIKKFFLISVIAHIVVLGAVYFLPAPQVNKMKAFTTRLVTPEEALRPKVVPLPKVKPVPIPPKTLNKVPKPLPAIPKPMKPLPPLERIPPRTPATPGVPVVPGEGKESGKPLPKGIIPKAGRGEDILSGGEKGEGRGIETSREESSVPGYREGYQPSGKPGLSTREKLFDKGVIGETAKKGTGGGNTGNIKDAITFDTRDYRFAGYMRKLREKIESIWEYPADAARRGLYGDLRIRFTIRKDGRLGRIELVRTSGYKSLDDAAIKALKDGEPYWPLPDEWGMDSYEILGHFIYTMYGYGLR